MTPEKQDYAVLKMPLDRPFRVLQLTDFHSDVKEYMNERTREDIQHMVRRHSPDLLALTGDIWCGDANPESAPMWMQRDIGFISSFGIPWTFIPGNHDYLGDFDETWAWLAKQPHALLPRGNGEGSFRIALRRRLSDETAWNLFFINTRDGWRLPEDLDWFKQENARLRQERGRETPAILYFHIPLYSYQQAMDEGRARGVAREDVLFWGDEKDTGTRIIAAETNVRACFCGHSHRNDFFFKQDGVVFAYGRCTGHGGYGEDVARGAKLLELAPESSHFRFRTVYGPEASTTSGMAT